MSTQVTFNGLIYSIPDTGDEDWGDYTTLFLVSVAQNALAKSGGIFELTNDVDFGSGYGLKSIYFKSRSTNIASAGSLRLSNTDSIAFRNSTNNGNLLLNLNGNILQFNGGEIIDANSTQTLTNKTIDADDNTILNLRDANIASDAAIAYPKLDLTDSIVDSDINSAAAIAGSKVNPNFVSQALTAGTGSFSGAVNLNSQLINNLANPVSDSDAANKAYVDSVAQGLDIKNAAALASTSNVVGTYIGSPTFTLTTAASSLTLDGVAVTNGQRVLLKAQTDATQNGIYTVSGVGSTVVLTRSSDANTSAELEGAFIFVSNGSTLANTGWVMNTFPFTIDVSNCVWTQFSGAGTYTASGGIVLTGTNFAVGTSGSNGISDSMVNIAAAIARTKLASGTASHVLINDVSGVMSSEAQLSITRGGTGQATANTGFNALAPTTTRGDLIYRNATVNARLAVGAANTVLTSDGTDPSYALIVNANIDNAAAIARAKIAAGTANHVLINDGSGNLSSEARLALSRFAAGTAGLPLVAQGTGSDSTYSQISLSAAVTGTLPVANGGTGSSLSSLTAEDVILGASSSAFKRLAVGSNGNVLTVTAGAVAWSTFTISGNNTGDVTLASFGSVPNGNGASLSGQVLTLQPADGSNPGGVSTTTQTFAGNKTFSGTIAASNFSGSSSGSNTGDVTIGTANGLSLVGQALSLALASTSTTGALSSTDWNTFNSKQASGNYITALTGDITASGPGSVAATLATVATGATVGSSTSIPTFTFNNKGLVTSASSNAVIAPAGTLTGTTLASNVVSSSLTTLGAIAQNLLPDANNTRDLGLTGTRWANLWLGGNATVSGQILASDGTNNLPGFGFSGEAGLGVYRSGTKGLGFAVNSILAAQFNDSTALELTTANLRANSGSVGTPSLSFINSSTTGFWRKAADSVGFSSAGVEVGNYSSIGAWTFGPSTGLGTTGSAYHTLTGSIMGSTLGNLIEIGARSNTFISSNTYFDGAFTRKAKATVTGYSYLVTGKGTSASDTLLSLISNYSQAQTANAALNTTGELEAIRVLADGHFTIAPSGFTGTHTVNGAINATLGLIGVTTNSNAATGTIGEYVETKVTTPTTWTVIGSPSTWGDFATISLTAGDWDVTGVFEEIPNGATLAGTLQIVVSLFSGTTTTDHVAGVNMVQTTVPAGGTAGRSTSVPVYRVSVASTTTVYLKANLAYTVATPQYQCRLSARRVR